MWSEEVGRLEGQLVEGELSCDEFLALLLPMYELETSKSILLTVIHNARSRQGARNKQVVTDLVRSYEDFFCESLDFEESDSGCSSDSTQLELSLSLNEVKLEPEVSQSKPSSNRKKKKKPADKNRESPVILWFRRDLRLYDNPALVKACSLNKAVIPVFIWNEEEEGSCAAGGATKVWLEETLKVFSRTLEDGYGSKLILRRAKSVQEELLSLVRETGARDVVWTALYEPHLKERDARIECRLQGTGVRVHTEHSYLLHRPDQVTTRGVGPVGIGSVPHFMECCKQSPGERIGEPVDPPTGLPAPPSWPHTHAIQDLGLYTMPRRKDGSPVDWAKGIREHWTFGEEGGYANLRRFLDDNLDHYDKESGRADEPWTAVISPYLHWGELSPRLVLHEAFRHKISAKFRRKLAWRDMSYWLLSLFPNMDHVAVRPAFRHQRWNEDRSLLARWQKGTTGFPLVDAAMRQLWSVGWMNNYMRHVVASFLLSYLRFSWQDGYAWFQDTLLDADVAINAMMWQNGGFSGVDQWNFVMHPVAAAQTCDPRGAYVRRWVPELAGLPEEWVHQPWRCSPATLRRAGVHLGTNYPHRCILDLEAARERSLGDVVEVRTACLKLGRFIERGQGRDVVPIPARLLDPGQGAGGELVLVPLITRREFIHQTAHPGEDNPYSPVLGGYVTRRRDEEVARTNRVDLQASTMLECRERKARQDKRAGVEDKEEKPKRSFGGRGRGRRNIVQ